MSRGGWGGCVHTKTCLNCEETDSNSSNENMDAYEDLDPAYTPKHLDKSHLIEQNELNDDVSDLHLYKQAELLGSHLQEWNLQEKSTCVCVFVQTFWG